MLSAYLSARSVGAASDIIDFLGSPPTHHPLYFAFLPRTMQQRLRALAMSLFIQEEEEENNNSRSDGECLFTLTAGYIKGSYAEDIDLQGEAGCFTLIPDVEQTMLFVRGGRPNSEQLNVEDLHHCFTRYGFVAATALSERDFYVEVESPEQALAAVKDTDTHPWLHFVAFKGTMFQASDLPISLLDETIARKRQREELEGTALYGGRSDDFMGGDLSLAAKADSEAIGDNDFVPDLVIDGLSLWTSETQLREFFADHGKVLSVRFSENDRNGTHYGCASVRMATFNSSVRAQEALHGMEIHGHKVVVGYLDPSLTLRHLLTDDIVSNAPTGGAPVQGSNQNSASTNMQKRSGFPEGMSGGPVFKKMGRMPHVRTMGGGGGVVCHYCRQPGHTMHECVVRSREMAARQDW